MEKDGEVGLFAMDFASGRAYRINAQEVDPAMTGGLFAAARGERGADLVDIPRAEIMDVIRAKDEVLNNNKKVFTGGENARG